jgi:hypothetical protein
LEHGCMRLPSARASDHLHRGGLLVWVLPKRLLGINARCGAGGRTLKSDSTMGTVKIFSRYEL